jgi:predicted CXXCH cytochrome family protein
MFKNSKHIILLFSILFVLLVAGLILRKALQPNSYGFAGNYRWDANYQIMQQPVLNQSSKVCSECHENIYNLHEKDAHYNVPCVDCHGAGNVHVAYFKGDSLKGITRKQAYLEKDFKLDGCLLCHQKLKARPADFPQIIKDEHYKFLHVKEPATECISCHNPHEPIFLLTEVKNSRLHPIVYKCTECHSKTPEKSFKEAVNHPSIFECKDCHAEISADFKSKSHSKYIDCRTCHLYHKENENTGRIYKNGNAKFCLLCHEKKSFKDEKYPPKIEWSTHVGNSEIISKSDEKICLNCHEDKIHMMHLSKQQNPHSVNWKADHREIAKQNQQVCMKCHTTQSCYNCHMKNKPVSHTADWKKKLHISAGTKNESSCVTCHKKNPCNGCHKLDMPHPKDFGDTHKNLIEVKGKNLCNKCHDQDFCKLCH